MARDDIFGDVLLVLSSVRKHSGIISSINKNRGRGLGVCNATRKRESKGIVPYNPTKPAPLVVLVKFPSSLNPAGV